MKESINKWFMFSYAAIPYIWGLMSITYMISGMKFNAFSMLSVVICWLVDRHRNKDVAQSN